MQLDNINLEELVKRVIEHITQVIDIDVEYLREKLNREASEWLWVELVNDEQPVEHKVDGDKYYTRFNLTIKHNMTDNLLKVELHVYFTDSMGWFFKHVESFEDVLSGHDKSFKQLIDIAYARVRHFVSTNEKIPDEIKKLYLAHPVVS